MSSPIQLRVALYVCLGLSVLFSEQSYSEEIVKRSGLEVEVGLTGWLMTEGQTKWSHAFSELVYQDVGTNVIEFSGKATLKQLWFLRANYGFGDIGDGDLTDDDFSSPGGPLISRTQSDIKGDDLWYVNADLGITVFRSPGHRGSLSLFTGFQYWRQQHRAQGVTQVACTAVGTFCSQPGTVSAQGIDAITNTATWTSFKLGVEGEYRFTRRFSVEGRAAFIPYTSLTNNDVHHLRTADVVIAPGVILPALQQDPSFQMTGTGIGANLEATASYMVVNGLFLSLGYRYWWNRVTDGTVTAFPVNFPSESINLNEFQTTRQGVTLGLTYKF